MSSGKTFSAWAEIFGALVHRLVRHAEVVALKSDSYRLRGRKEDVLGPSRSR